VVTEVREKFFGALFPLENCPAKHQFCFFALILVQQRWGRGPVPSPKWPRPEPIGSVQAVAVLFADYECGRKHLNCMQIF
jgi:hypothetical protein